ncbi:MAG: TIM barrel protein [Verrucomicrobia bacterium]|nr:TIM barrel protein [Verrucomicrobiota bacterium]
MNAPLNPSHELRFGTSERAVLSRRQFLKLAALGGATAGVIPPALAKGAFKLNYILSSSMYGTLPLSTIMPEVEKTGASTIDIWPRVHGSQREQMEEMGHDQFRALLKQHDVRLGCITRYDLGPYNLQPEMKVCAKLGGDLLICGGSGPKGLSGGSLKNAVRMFAEKMKPHAEAAEAAGVKIGIENHSSNLINTPDSLKWLLEFSPSKTIGIAMAPYHLESLGQAATDLAKLVKQLGNRLFMFYAWQHGMGCMKKLPKEQELLQMPGRGKLDFTPIIRSLKSFDYSGYTAIFMHPVPRGIPILPTAAKTTAEINRARSYLEKCLTKS